MIDIKRSQRYVFSALIEYLYVYTMLPSVPILLNTPIDPRKFTPKRFRELVIFTIEQPSRPKR